MKLNFYIIMLLFFNIFLQASEYTSETCVTPSVVEPVNLRDQVAQYLYQEDQQKLALIQKIKDDRTALLLKAAKSLKKDNVNRVALKEIRNNLSDNLEKASENGFIINVLQNIKKRHRKIFLVCGDFVSSQTIQTETFNLKNAITKTLRTDLASDETLNYVHATAPLMSSQQMNGSLETPCRDSQK